MTNMLLDRGVLLIAVSQGVVKSIIMAAREK